jgi:hypothetical protein
MHLNAAELVDLAEGTRPESSAPHLAGCARCRRQMLEMRAMMAAASAAVHVPEPSPLFWDHLSNRVRQAVADEATAPRRRWHDLATWRRFLVPASAVAIASLVVTGLLTWRTTGPQPHVAGRALSEPGLAVAPEGTTADPFDDAAGDDDSLMLVADLSAAMNLDPANDAEPAPNGSAEHAVTHLNDEELRELERLLQQELAPTGA